LEPNIINTIPKINHIMLNIGFGNVVAANRVIAIASPNSAPAKRLKDEARDDKRLIDVTQGRKTRSVLIMDSNHVILSAIQTETIAQRLSTLMEANNGQ
jgi:extracellular matrix regulatory protein A